LGPDPSRGSLQRGTRNFHILRSRSLTCRHPSVRNEFATWKTTLWCTMVEAGVFSGTVTERALPDLVGNAILVRDLRGLFNTVSAVQAGRAGWPASLTWLAGFLDRPVERP
jgi:hypothetical protein